MKKKERNSLADSVDYLGFIIDKNGRYISLEKTKLLLNMLYLEDVCQLRSFRQMINHHAKFLSNLCNKCTVSSRTTEEKWWHWTDGCQETFESVNQELVRATRPAHFDLVLPFSRLMLPRMASEQS